MSLLKQVCLLIPALTGLLFSSLAHSQQQKADQIIPLSFTLGAGVIPGGKKTDVTFRPSRLIQFELLYQIKDNLGGGLGASFLDRQIDTNKAIKEYNISTLSWIMQWHPDYSANKANFYLGAKANVHVIRYGEKGGLDDEEKGENSWGLEPYFGVLIPTFLPHQFLDIGVSYQWRRFPELYHLQPEKSVKNVDDSQVLLFVKVRI